MPTTTHQSVSAVQVLQTIQGFLKTVDQLDIDLDDILITDSTLSTLIESSAFFQEEYVDQLEDLRDLAGACIAQACKAAHIHGFRHWTDNHPDPLATNFQEFQRQYYEFLTSIREVAGQLEAEAGEEITEQDLTALYSLTAPLSSPLMLAKAYVTAQKSPVSL